MLSNPKNNPEKFLILQREIENSLGNLLLVPNKIISPDPYIAKAKLTMSNKIKHHSWEGFVSSGNHEPDILTTPKNANRALRIMDTLLKCFIARGYRVEHEYSFSRVYIRNCYFQIKIRELRKQMTPKENDVKKYIPTGILEFSLDNFRGTRWKDGLIKLENQILKILTSIEFEVNELNEYWDNNARKKRIQEEKDYLEELRENYALQEINYFKNLLLTAKRWKDAQVLREYLKEIEESNTSSPELDYWLHWAKEKLTWYEPNLNIVDGILNNSDQNSL